MGSVSCLRTGARCGVAIAVAAALGGTTVPVSGQGSAGDKCDIRWIPKELPPLTEIVDSAAFATGLAAIVAPAGGGTVLLTMRQASGMERPSMGVIGADLPDSIQAAVAGLVQATLHPRNVAEPWGIRLRIVLAGGSSARVEPAGYCEPRPITGRSSFTLVTNSDAERAAIDNARPARVVVTVSRIGGVVDVRLRPGSGSRVLDEEIESQAWQMGFAPATVDGLPVQATYEYTVRFGR